MPTKALHCFVSEQGDLLPRWQEAFPKAAAYGFGDRVRARRTQVVVWTRLLARPPAGVLAQARQMFGDDAICVVLADIPDDEQALACFAAGARGYCNTHAVPELLRQVAEVVTQGGLWIGETLMQRLLRGTAQLLAAQPPVAALEWGATLTKREREVAQAVAAGASNKEVARQCKITERTVKAHVGAVLEKLGVRDRLQLAIVINSHRTN